MCIRDSNNTNKIDELLSSDLSQGLSQGLSQDLSSNSTFTIHPKVCDFNNDKTLMNEPGIHELVELYKDSDYDFVNGRFKQMSEETQKEYLEDLKLFYNIFTGNNVTELPSDIKSFADIKLSKYKNNPNCTGSEKMLEQSIKGSVTKPLFIEYAKNIKQMMQNMKENQEILLNIINKLFVYHFNDITGKKEIKINPELKETDLPGIILETRQTIIKLYLTCEKDYITGVEIYEAIIEQKIFDTATRQINYFRKNLDNFTDENM